MKTGFKLSIFLAIFILLVSGSAHAQKIQLDAKGKQQMITLAPGANGTMTAYVLSKGNETQYVTFNIQAPNGTKVTAKSIVVGKSKPVALLAKTTGWANVNFYSPTGKESSTLVVGKGVQAVRKASYTPVKLAATTSEYYCGPLTGQILDAAIDFIREYQGVTYSRNQLCGLYGYTPGVVGEDVDAVAGGDNPSNGGDTGNGGGSTIISGTTTSETVQVILRKDTCGQKNSAVYLLKFDISFGSVPAENLVNGADIYISALPIIFRGSKASSLKPHSDGKFAPRALFLMATTGGYSWYGSGNTEKVNVVKWSSKGPSITKTLKIEDMVYWRGHSLARIIAEPVLRGGKGVVEMQSNAGVYSVCFALSKYRQKYNGYS